MEDTFELAQTMVELYYVEVARWLPLEEIPELMDCIHMGGLCIGLANPVSNIILNAINLLFGRSGELSVKTACVTFGFDPSSIALPSRFLDPSRKETWMRIALKSHSGLIMFMHAYFRYLTDTQARQYLNLTGHDLALAIQLVNRDRY